MLNCSRTPAFELAAVDLDEMNVHQPWRHDPHWACTSWHPQPACTKNQVHFEFHYQHHRVFNVGRGAGTVDVQLADALLQHHTIVNCRDNPKCDLTV